jgi:hypothetical protein
MLLPLLFCRGFRSRLVSFFVAFLMLLLIRSIERRFEPREFFLLETGPDSGDRLRVNDSSLPLLTYLIELWF